MKPCWGIGRPDIGERRLYHKIVARPSQHVMVGAKRVKTVPGSEGAKEFGSILTRHFVYTLAKSRSCKLAARMKLT